MSKHDTWKALTEPVIPDKDRHCGNCKRGREEYDAECERIKCSYYIGNDEYGSKWEWNGVK